VDCINVDVGHPMRHPRETCIIDDMQYINWAMSYFCYIIFYGLVLSSIYILDTACEPKGVPMAKLIMGVLDLDTIPSRT
jgi:hypothetical protein